MINIKFINFLVEPFSSRIKKEGKMKGFIIEPFFRDEPS